MILIARAMVKFVLLILDEPRWDLIPTTEIKF